MTGPDGSVPPDLPAGPELPTSSDVVAASGGPAAASRGPAAPPYGRATLAELVPSLLAGAGVPGAEDVLGLDAGPRVCLLLVDGMGRALLDDHRDLAPFLASRTDAGPLWAGFPSTTATSLASLGTGLPPARHGVLGFRVRVPGTDRVLHALRWDDGVDPLAWQPYATAFDRGVSAGVAVSHVAPAAFARSGLTRAALRGPAYRGADAAGERVAETVAALAGPGPSLCLTYHGDLDATGHRRGVGSDAWRAELAHTDRLAAQLADALPSGTTLVVTADHGMVDVPGEARVDADAVPALREGVTVLAGEPRARYVHARPGAADDVAAAWRDVLGDGFCVRTRDEAVADGWFGPDPDPPNRERIGDVVAVAAGRGAVVAREREAPESRLVGMHGALTEAETRVPLLVHRS